MNQQWQDFTLSQGAKLEANNIIWPDAPTSADYALSDLSHLGLIKATGEDVVSFLQGQLTNDTELVDAQHAQIAAYCTPKGRMLALMRLFMIDDAIYIQLPTSRLADTLKRLSMFVMRSKVVLSDASDEFVAIGLSGQCASDLLENAPNADHAVTRSNGLTAIGVAGDPLRFMLLGDVQAIQQYWQASQSQATVVNEDYWPLLDIHAGIPSVVSETVEAFVPQMANLQLLDAVSFTKGCYTGQEIVARMHYLGQLKRRMYLAHTDAELVKAGDELFAQSNASGQGAGKVVDARPALQGGWDMLIVTPTKNVEANDLQLTDAEGAKLIIQELPYPFESSDD